MSLLENIVERPLNMLRKKNVRDQQFSLKINVSRVERRKVEKKIKIVLCTLELRSKDGRCSNARF